MKARLFGSSWAIGPRTTVSSPEDALAWAKSYGTTADTCIVYTLPKPAVRANNRFYCRVCDAHGMATEIDVEQAKSDGLCEECAAQTRPDDSVVAQFRRDPSGDGTTWHQATI